MDMIHNSDVNISQTEICNPKRSRNNMVYLGCEDSGQS